VFDLTPNLAQLYKMEEEDDEVIFACSTIIFTSVGIAASAIARHTRTHSVWVKEYIRDRERFGAYHTLIPHMADTDTARCVQYLRIDSLFVHSRNCCNLLATISINLDISCLKPGFRHKKKL